MNSYSKILEPAVLEIDGFAASTAGKRSDAAWFEKLKERVKSAIAAPNDGSAEDRLDAIGWIVVDSGPLGQGFAPSIDKALDAMQRKRKQRFKDKRLAEAGRGE